MAGTQTELGISPVLLQAITHTLSSTSGQASCDMKPGTALSQPIVMMRPPAESKSLLHNMHQSVEQLKVPKVEPNHSADETVIILQNVNADSKTGNGEKSTEHRYVIKNMPGGLRGISSDLNMGQVLSAIASHLKTMQGGHEVNAAEVPVTDSNHVVTELVIKTTPAEDMPPPPDDETQFEQPWMKKIRLVHGDVPGGDGRRMEEINMFCNHAEAKLQQNLFEGGISLAVATDISSGPCPICGDRISGYHYGIYSCESCKGFFKRTVQNKKVFVCHHNADCAINVANRKKCPACRFKRCLLVGMKLEAIRSDRTRGGRSSYDGCTPKFKRVKQLGCVTPATPPSSSSSAMTTATIDAAPQSTTASPMVAVLATDTDLVLQPHTPSILDDLLTVESLMADDGTDQPCCVGLLTASDTDPFTSLLHLADHCLYKIVRWARNLPQFASISTDDQIQLLQHSWTELLFMCVCAHSVHSTSQLKLVHGITLDKTCAVAAGVQDISERLLDFTAHLRRMQLDTHEFITLKVLILLSPDVPGLQDILVVQRHQDELSEALLIHTRTNYPQHPLKYSEMLARVSELSRTSSLARELLGQRQVVGDVSPYSLLSELLRGDLAVS